MSTCVGRTIFTGVHCAHTNFGGREVQCNKNRERDFGKKPTGAIQIIVRSIPGI